MTFNEIVRLAQGQNATDVHLEPGLPITLRVHGELLRTSQVASRDLLHQIAQELLPDMAWDDFWAKGSADLTRVVSGVQCRVNVMKSDRGVGMAIRLLSSITNTLKTCNLHPQLLNLIDREVGLILLTGPTGSGKSTTLSALIEEINQRSSKHIVTLESPIEYRANPKKSLIRQREVGIHTPSYEQGLMDALREDPDVIVVGEMRDAESMRWTLNAAETGHLVIATMHASNASDAVYRMIMSFAPERQASIQAQLADALVAIVSQNMTFRSDLSLSVPTLEILMGTHASKNAIRKGEVMKLLSIMQAGGPDGHWTFDRYKSWLAEKTDWVFPKDAPAVEAVESFDSRLFAKKPKKVLKEESEQTVSVTPKAVGPVEVSGGSGQTFIVPDGPPDVRRVRGKGGGKQRMVDPSVPLVSAVEPMPPGKAMRIHKDGRIEIPAVDVDLDALVREINLSEGEG